MNTYDFDVKNHIHLLNQKPLHGVTTVLQVISKPMLIQWSANMAVDYIEQNFPSAEEVMTKWDTFKILFKEARTAHRKKKESAGDWGTNVHKAIEEWIKEKKEPVFSDQYQFEAFLKFKKWANENNVEFLESEKHVWSEKMWVGGICDLVIKMNGKKYIADIKTSSGIYNEHFFQMAAYALCLEEMGEHQDVEGYLVINLKKDGTMDLKMAHDMELNKQAFTHALGLHKIINSIK